MKITDSRIRRHWLSGLCLALMLAVPAARAVDMTTDIVVPLNERLLTHLETTATGLAAKEQADRAVRKDFEACMTDKKITGTTFDEMTASMAARHPRAAAALAAEGWKMGEFYLAYLTVLSMPVSSEYSRGGEPDENKGVRQNVAFYDKHKARMLALIEKMNPLAGLDGKKN